jgi:hypothetical protein
MKNFRLGKKVIRGRRGPTPRTIRKIVQGISGDFFEEQALREMSNEIIASDPEKDLIVYNGTYYTTKVNLN